MRCGVAGYSPGDVAPRYKATEIPYYEGLVRKTAAMYAPHIQEDYEDIVAILRIKVWRALLAYEASRSNHEGDAALQRFVFSCVKNQVKDLLKRKKRNEVFMDDIAPRRAASSMRGQTTDRDRFEYEHGLAVDHDVVFGHVETPEPRLPNTLSNLEREIAVRLYMSFSQKEISAELEMSRAEVERAVRSIRTKMADWQPNRRPAPERVAA